MKSADFDRLVADLTPIYGPGEARSIARILFEDAFGRIRALGEEDQARFARYRQRLLAGEPVQYVLGMADFYGMKLRVSPAVLIPRQETEELVAWALDLLRQRSGSQPEALAVLDIGTGSGCIALAIKKHMPESRVSGIDLSEEALALAAGNALRLGLEVEWRHADVLEIDRLDGLYDLIVSNPPYIPRSEKPLMPQHVLAHEPELALFTPDADPLVFYRVIAGLAKEALRSGGQLLFEVNEFRAGGVAALLQEAGFAHVEIRKDIAGAERMVLGC